MNFSHELQSNLKQIGFQRHPLSSDGHYFFLEKTPRYFHGLKIESSGESAKAFYAFGVISFVNHGYLTKKLCELELIKKIAKDQQHGWTEFASDFDAMQWIQSLRACADSELAAIESEHFENLERRTRNARAAIAKYLDDSLTLVRSYDESKAIARKAGVCQIPDGFHIYERAIDVLLERKEEIEPDVVFDFDKPVACDELSFRIQLLASELFWKQEVSS